MALKFFDGKGILLYCNICGKTVFKAENMTDKNISISDYTPTIQETYKVFCEKCYMEPILKIRELTGEMYPAKKKLKKMEKKVRRDKEKFLNEFY